MKRLSFALLSVLLMFGLTSLVACGGGDAGHQGGAEEAAPAGPVEDDGKPAEESAEPESTAPAESDPANAAAEEGGEGEDGGAAAEGDLEVPSAAGDGDGGDVEGDNQG